MKRLIFILILLMISISCFVGVACGGGNNNPPQDPPPIDQPGDPSDPEDPDESDEPDDPGMDDTKPKNKVEINQSNLYNQYFTGDVISLTNASLNYAYGTLDSEICELTLPDGSKQTGNNITLSTVGEYKVTYYLELYKEIIYAEQTITVSDWDADAFSELEISSIVCNDSCIIGNNFVAPDTAFVNYFGTPIQANFEKVVTSGGSHTDKTFSFTYDDGCYLRYIVTVNGRNFYADKLIEKDNMIYTFSGSKSSATYSLDKASLSIAEGEYFDVAKEIDFASLTSSQTLVEFKLKAQSSNATNGLPDAMRINFKFTDIGDPEKYVILQLNKRWDLPEYRDWADGQSSAFAGGEGQTLLGSNNGARPAEAGCTLMYSMLDTQGANSVAFKFNYENKSVYVSVNGGADQFVVDLDDYDTYYGNANIEHVLWGGLPSGKARLTIYCEEYKSDNKLCNIELTKLLDFSFTNDVVGTFVSGGSASNVEFGSSVTLTDKDLSDGKTSYTASVAKIIAPDGSVLTGPSITFDKLGKYEIMYSTQYDSDRLIYATYTYFVSEVSVQLATPLLGQYKQNSSLVVPSGKLNVLGDLYDATVKVTAPDTTDVTASTITLSQVGAYTLTYTADVDGAQVSKSVTIQSVSGDVIALSGSNSATTLTAIDSVLGHKGALLNLVAGDTAILNTVIDWTSANTVDGTGGSTYFCGFYLDFRQSTVAEYQSAMPITFRFTNVNDASEYLDIVIGHFGDNMQLTVELYYCGEQVSFGGVTSQYLDEYAGSDGYADKGKVLIRFKPGTVYSHSFGGGVTRQTNITGFDFTKAVVSVFANDTVKVGISEIGNISFYGGSPEQSVLTFANPVLPNGEYNPSAPITPPIEPEVPSDPKQGTLTNGNTLLTLPANGYYTFNNIDLLIASTGVNGYWPLETYVMYGCPGTYSYTVTDSVDSTKWFKVTWTVAADGSFVVTYLDSADATFTSVSHAVGATASDFLTKIRLTLVTEADGSIGYFLRGNGGYQKMVSSSPITSDNVTLTVESDIAVAMTVEYIHDTAPGNYQG